VGVFKVVVYYFQGRTAEKRIPRSKFCSMRNLMNLASLAEPSQISRVIVAIVHELHLEGASIDVKSPTLKMHGRPRDIHWIMNDSEFAVQAKLVSPRPSYP
jgi:hypothetical protein